MTRFFEGCAALCACLGGMICVVAREYVLCCVFCGCILNEAGWAFGGMSEEFGLRMGWGGEG